MVEMTEPHADDLICDPASGTCGFLVAAGEYLREHRREVLHDRKANEHFNRGMFHGYDFDNTMLRIGSMNMLLHGIEAPDIRSETASPKAPRPTKAATHSSSPTRPSPAASTTRTPRRTCCRSSRRRRRNCCSWRSSCAC